MSEPNHNPPPPAEPENEPTEPVDANDSRRQFVRKLTRTATYVAPVVVTLAASKQAFGSGPSGPS